MKKSITIACIPPKGRNDYLADTVFDGLSSLQQNPEERNISIIVPDYYYPSQANFPKVKKLSVEEFTLTAKKSDLILLFNAGPQVEEELAEKIDMWQKTFFIDGSELGRNKRLDVNIMKSVTEGTYEGGGKIRFDLLKKAAGYFRREPPYLEGVTALPFGIEKKYIKYSEGTKKDIDFVCIFGQEEYPPLRKEIRLALEDFCRKNNFSCVTKQTKIPFFNIHSKLARNRFYKTLARGKVGISVAGGGFDTLRFWEILGNNCFLLTDKIKIYKEDSTRLKYDRIFEFEDLASFNNKLAEIGEILRSGKDSDPKEYQEILKQHSSESRALEILHLAERRGLI